MCRNGAQNNSSSLVLSRVLIAAAEGGSIGPYMLNIGEIFENYRIVRLLSRRDTGNVYQAVDRQSGRPVGIQVFPWSFSGDERSIRRMWREAAPVYKLEHPVICRISRVGHFHDLVFLVTDLLEGSSLDYVIGGKPPACDVVISYALQIASALQAAHGIGILHLGLNPENIFVTSLGLKLLDFGIATPIRAVFPEREEALRLAFAGSSAGGTALTFCTHLSPEQAGGMPVDARSDLFSLGAVLYEMATGVPAFGSSQANQAPWRLLQISPPPPTTLNSDIPAACRFERPRSRSG